jgi:phosphoribosylanthranilate isomerase
MTGRGPLWIKVCGITQEADAQAALHAGASALGLNFVGRSKRLVDVATARRIADSVRGRIELVGVVADESHARIQQLIDEVGLDWVQAHGSEPVAFFAGFPRLFKAFGVASEVDVELAASFPGERLLVDSKLQGVSGGTGLAFDWRLVERLAATRPLVLAGGLTPGNVAAAVAHVGPFGVDVAGGVELATDPRRKDPEKLALFVANARRAHAERA